MDESAPTTQTLKISELKNRLSRMVNEVYRKETRVLVEKAGIPVAALVSIDDLRQLARLDAQRAERRRIVDAMREPFRGVPAAEVEQEAADAVSAVQAEMRAEREAVTNR